MCKHVLATTADFRANHHAAVSVLHFAVADDDVLGGHVALTSIAVASALDGDAVVARIEETVLDQHAVAALRVTAVTVGTVVDHLHAAHGDVGRMQGMDDPEWRAKQGDVFHQNALTLVEVHQLWAQTVFRTEDALRCALSFLVVHGNAVLTVLQQSWASLVLLCNHTLFPSVAGSSAPGPPCLV